MNTKQVRALANLMEAAAPPRHMYADEDEPFPELHVKLEVAQGADDGNTYEASFWTVETGYRFPDPFYLRSSGTVYVYDSEQDVAWDLVRTRWEHFKAHHRWELVAVTHHEPTYKEAVREASDAATGLDPRD